MCVCGMCMCVCAVCVCACVCVHGCECAGMCVHVCVRLFALVQCHDISLLIYCVLCVCAYQLLM